MTINDGEEDLSATLSMLRGYMASFVVRAAIDTGLFDVLERGETRNGLRGVLACDDRVTDALLVYLGAERIIEQCSDGVYALTELGRRLSRQRGWFRLFVGGYASVLTQLVDLLTGRASGDFRDLAAVALGSGDISVFDAIPLAARLIVTSGHRCRRLLDVGCGNGRLLCGLLDRFEGATAVAIDPSRDALDAAQQMITETPHAARIKLIQGDVLASTADIAPPDFVLAAFVLQEIHGQEGRPATVQYLRTLGERWPQARWIVIEVDHRPTFEVLRTPHGLGYYNGYYLLHPLTRQELLPREQWERVFLDAGFVVEEAATANPAVDPTGLELGFRLVRC